MKKNYTIPFLFAALASPFIASCAREPQVKRLEIGQTVDLQPIDPKAFMLRDLNDEEASFKLEVSWGGRPVARNQDLTLKFWGDDGNLLYERNWADLEKAYKSTGCSNKQIATLDGYLLGVALICDGDLNIAQVKRITGSDKSGKTRKTDSWNVYPIGNQVYAVSIGLY